MSVKTPHAGRDDAISRYFNQPSTFKVGVFVVAYLAFYLAVSYLVGLLAGDRIDQDNVVSSAESIVLALVVPIGIGALVLVWFAHHNGWLREIVGRQPVRGSWWMGIGVVLVLAAVAGHVVQIDWNRWSGPDLAAFAALGICVGLAEELATRGVAVKMLRDAGHTEKFVAVGSSVAFALMHSVNLLSGMSAKTVISTVVYTFGFGMCMYLAMRLTGTIWAAIVLHGMTDPTTFLAVGGLDHAVGDSQGVTTPALVAAVATFALIGFGILAAFLVRGRSTPRESPHGKL